MYQNLSPTYRPLQLSVTHGKLPLQMRVLRELMIIHSSLCMPKLATSYGEKALSIAKEIDAYVAALIYYDLAGEYKLSKEKVTSLSCYKECLLIAKKIRHKVLMLKVKEAIRPIKENHWATLKIAFRTGLLNKYRLASLTPRRNNPIIKTQE
jgi:hypothetical protein